MRAKRDEEQTMYTTKSVLVAMFFSLYVGVMIGRHFLPKQSVKQAVQSKASEPDPCKKKLQKAQLIDLERQLDDCMSKVPCSEQVTRVGKTELPNVHPKKPVSMDDSIQRTIDSKKKRVFRKKMSPAKEKRSLKNLSHALRNLGETDHPPKMSKTEAKLRRALRDLPAEDNTMNEKMAPVKDHEPERHFLE